MRLLITDTGAWNDAAFTVGNTKAIDFTKDAKLPMDVTITGPQPNQKLTVPNGVSGAGILQCKWDMLFLFSTT